MKEAELPIDIDPLKYDLKTHLKRKQLLKINSGLNSEVGYVLPLNFGITKWITSKWELTKSSIF